MIRRRFSMSAATTSTPKTGKLKAGVPVEPLVLRANAGDCIEVTLFNKLPANVPDVPGWNTLPMIVEGFNANQVKPSNQVGLHPQLRCLRRGVERWRERWLQRGG